MMSHNKKTRELELMVTLHCRGGSKQKGRNNKRYVTGISITLDNLAENARSSRHDEFTVYDVLGSHLEERNQPDGGDAGWT